MTLIEFFQAIFMGAVEAATEFLPVSSTGHLILAGRLIGFEGPPGHIFEVAIQLGAVLAVVVLYFRRLLNIVTGLPKDAGAQRFALVSIIAFIPAVVSGVLLYDVIKSVLFTPWVVCAMLVAGGIGILLIEKLHPNHYIHSIEEMPVKTGFFIGLIQCLALIPGVSRSGATIMGALALGVDRKVAAEFSFFQAIPLLAGAALYDLWKNRAAVNESAIALIGVGFIASFVFALIVIKWMIGYVQRNGFGVFAWYRIVAGSVGLIVLLFV